MRYARMIGCFVVALLLVSTLPYAAEAAAVKVKPQQFKPCKAADTNNWTEPSHIEGDGGSAQYYAVVNLPVGRTITSFTVWYSGTGSTINGGLYRVRIGENWQVVSAISETTTPGPVLPVTDTSIDRPHIKAGFTYYVWLNLGPHSTAYGVKINYE